LRLLELPDDVLAMVERGELSEGHARAVLAVPDQDGRRRLARQIVRTGMSVRSAERAARWAGARQKPARRKAGIDPALAERVQLAARRLLGREVTVRAGRLEVPYADRYDLAVLAESLERAGARFAAES
jgi:ParB family chromosome partitioning protein